MTTKRDVWGPYRSQVEGRLSACEDDLGRLRRSVDGEIAPDRHYFDEKAHMLRDAAQALVEHVEDVEWWLGACTEKMVLSAPGDSTYIAECGLAQGHAGAHQQDELCPEHRVLAEVRGVSRALQHVTDRLAWGLLTVRADAGVTDPETLASELRPLQVRLAKAVSALVALAAAGNGEDE